MHADNKTMETFNWVMIWHIIFAITMLCTSQKSVLSVHILSSQDHVHSSMVAGRIKLAIEIHFRSPQQCVELSDNLGM